MDNINEMDTDTILEDADMEGDSSSDNESGAENVEKGVYLPGKPLGCDNPCIAFIFNLNLNLFWFCRRG